MTQAYLNVEEFDFLGRRWWIALTSEDMCVILTHFSDGRRVALRQIRPKVSGRVLTPPMGVFSARSSAEGLDDARREAESETGYRVLDIRYLFTVYRSPGLTNQRAHVYVATLGDEHIGQALHVDEDIKVITLPGAFTPNDVFSEFDGDHFDAAFWYYFLPDVATIEL